MRKLHIVSLCVGVSLMLACTSVPPVQPVFDREQATESVVRLNLVDIPNAAGGGCGVVIYDDAETSLILTAWHVAYNIEQLPVEVPPPLPEDVEDLLKTLHGPGCPHRAREVVTARVLEAWHKGKKYKTEVMYSNRGRDVALLKTSTPVGCPVISWAHDITPGEEVIVIGRARFFPSLLLISEGRYQGYDAETKFEVSIAEAHPGCSGGPTMVKRSGKWALLGITTAVAGDGEFPIYHIVLTVQGSWIRAWLEGLK